MRSIPIDPARKKTVDFTPTTLTHLSDRYCPAPARNSSFVSTSSSHSSSNTPIIYSPPEESPPLNSNEYAGTILDLVTDPEEIREYRQLERKKESTARRKNSTTSSLGSSGSSGGSAVAGKGRRSGSISWGRNVCVGEQEEKERIPAWTYRQQSMNACPSSSSYSPSWSRQSYPHPHSYPHSSHPTYADSGAHGRRTTVADLSTNGNLAYFDTHSGNGVRQPFSTVQPQERMRDIPTFPSARFGRIGTDHASNGIARREDRDSTGEHVSSNASSPISPTMPLANIHASPPGAAPVTTNKPLFHPDLHPVADHHASADNNTHRINTNDLKCEMPTKWSSSSLPVDAMFTLMQSSSTGDSSSPSSGGTIRPSLVGDEGKPKAYTVADYRTLDEECMA
ncbi:hypothetical protein QFC22_006627 [Naganishia vaughanmartiniae]|uniref:Uncharacterized protein n=1 Tax=Naganishia vaughanmartiniae TaxID=1424756 RepID=A0ACC2WIW9_9TREE|nr:hypothetical protein QFC22_006627 [Naganishia vaughanmartiniae]